MDNKLVQTIARELLGLTLNESEAAALAQSVAGLQSLVRTVEQVPLVYSSDPFVSPATGDAWLETWPDK